MEYKYSDIRKFKYLDSQTCKRLHVYIFNYTDIEICEYFSICAFEYTDIQRVEYRNLNIQTLKHINI